MIQFNEYEIIAATLLYTILRNINVYFSFTIMIALTTLFCLAFLVPKIAPRFDNIITASIGFIILGYALLIGKLREILNRTDSDYTEYIFRTSAIIFIIACSVYFNQYF